MKSSPAIVPIAICILFLLAGCATIDSADPHARLFFEKLNRYPHTNEPLKIPKLLGTSYSAISNSSASPDVFIMVHPAYSLFFRHENRSKYTEAKYDLLAAQFENEARFIAEASKAEKIVVLIIPGKYESESTDASSYTAYLNQVAGGDGIFYLFSESPSSGSISMNDMVDLYRFLQGIKVRKVLIGGGYIGRCQREFYKELTSHFDYGSIFIVPEISIISPDDVTESEAVSILESIQRQDYSPLRKFIDKKLDNAANVLSIQKKRAM